MSKYRSHWTPEEEDLLRSLWRTKGKVQTFADEIGRPLRAVYLKAHKMGLPKRDDPKKLELSDSQRTWLKRNYPHMRTEICAMHLGISHSSTVRLARKLGVNKTDQFVRECQQFTARKAKESHLKNGTYPPKGVVTANLAKGEKYRFKPGHLLRSHAIANDKTPT